jgi:hypothetical protein
MRLKPMATTSLPSARHWALAAGIIVALWLIMPFVAALT